MLSWVRRIHCQASVVSLADTNQYTDAAPAGETPQLTAARNAIEVLHREQKAVLKRTMEGFLDYLAVAEAGEHDKTEVITEKAWHNRANWEDDKWAVWETWGWFRNWARTVSGFLHPLIGRRLIEDDLKSAWTSVICALFWVFLFLFRLVLLASLHPTSL